MEDKSLERPLWNPYVAGVALGLVLLASYVIMGFGLGSSSAPTRLAYAFTHLLAPVWSEANGYIGPYVRDGAKIFEDWMIFEVIGVFLGGIIGAYSGGRMKRGNVEMGPNTSRGKRLFFAFLGGAIMGVGARLARGCTSGQAMTGGAVLSVGSWIFMISVFVGGYLMAPIVRREWR